MIYDYTHDETGECLETVVRTLTTRQKEDALSFIHDLKSERKNKDREQYRQWLNRVVIPTLHEYAQETFSTLMIEENDDEVHIQLENKYGYDIGSSDRAIKLALFFVDYMGIDSNNGTIRMNLSYRIG